MILRGDTYTASQHDTAATVTTIHLRGLHFGLVVETASEKSATAIRPDGTSQTYCAAHGEARDLALKWLLRTADIKKVWALIDEIGADYHRDPDECSVCTATSCECMAVAR